MDSMGDGPSANVAHAEQTEATQNLLSHTAAHSPQRSHTFQRNKFASADEEALKLTEGKAILDMCRDTTCVRYRELYGIAYGDPSSVVGVDVGRGVEIFLWGLPPERRLPLRAYHAGFTLKNGVPINYIEGISIFERMELGFNTFYTYRDGETAWVYAQALRFLRQLVGVTCFSIDPYQIGFNNDEALESGAFWFYRKLGFRPTETRAGKPRRGGREKDRGQSRVSHAYASSKNAFQRTTSFMNCPAHAQAIGTGSRFAISALQSSAARLRNSTAIRKRFAILPSSK